MIERLGLPVFCVVVCATLSCGRSKQEPVSTAAPPVASSAEVAPEAVAPVWSSDVDRALEAARAAKRPSVVVFYAEWALASVKLRREVLGAAEFNTRFGSRFALVEIDATDDSAEDKAQLNRFGVETLPTLLVLDRQGKEVRRFSEFVDLAVLAPVLEGL